LQRRRNVHKRPGSSQPAARSVFKREKSVVTLASSLLHVTLMSSGAQTVATGCLEYRHLRAQLHATKP
jgi:hypothetical protein